MSGSYIKIKIMYNVDLNNFLGLTFLDLWAIKVSLIKDMKFV